MATDEFTSLPAHFERQLGEISRGWSDEKRTHGIQIVSFDNQPQVGIRTFATLGLSRHIVHLSSDRHIRQELLTSADHAQLADSVAGFLLSVAEHVLRRGKALSRGEVIGPETPVVQGSLLNAVYVTNPSPFDKSLVQFVSEPPETVFAYLIPIAAEEATLVHRMGWRWFEDQLERQDPDIWDLSRAQRIQADI